MASTPCSTAAGAAGLNPSAAVVCVNVYWPAGIPPKATTPGALSKSLASLSHLGNRHIGGIGQHEAAVAERLPSGPRLATESIPVSTGCSAVATGSGVDAGVAVASSSGVAVEVDSGSGDGVGVSACGSRVE